VYDALLLPALNYAERDRLEQRLSPDEETAVIDATRELLSDAAESTRRLNPETPEVPDRPPLPGPREPLRVLGYAINGAADGTFTADMGAWLDRERFLTHLAVENAVAESDGIVGHLGANNFYLYQYGGQRRFVFIPWDKDSCFSAATQSVFLRIDTNVLTRRLLADPAMQQIYVAALRRAVTSFVNDRYLTPRLETAYTQIREAALSDPYKPFSSSEFELGVGGLRGIIAAREADVLAQTGGR